MKVAELIEELKKMPQNAEVLPYTSESEDYGFTIGNVKAYTHTDDMPYAKGDKPDPEEFGGTIVIIG